MNAKYSYDEIVKNITDIYPQWIDDINTKNFADWLANQTNEVKQLPHSYDIKDALNCLSLYYNYFKLIKYH